MLKITKSFIILSLMVILPLLSACQQKVENRASSGRVRVVATFMPVYDAAVHVGGDLVDVTLLLPPGASPHTYEPTPTDSVALEEARIIFKLGLGLDDWVDRAVAGGADRGITSVAVSRGIVTIPLSDTENGHHECSGDHHHHGDDPHIWMDPMKMKEIAGNILEEYKKIMPDKSEQLQENYDRYTADLDRLDEKYRQTLEGFHRRDFVTFHPFMNYLSRRYDLNQVATVTGFAGKEPDPQKLIEVIEKLKEYRVKTVFAEPQFSPRASQAIAREIGGRVVIIDPVGSLGDPRRDTYIKNMETNLKALTEAFSEDGGKNGKP